MSGLVPELQVTRPHHRVVYDDRWSILSWNGHDLAYNFTSTVYGETLSDRAVNIIEYEVHKNASWDLFTHVWNVTSGGIHHTMSMG